MGASAFYVVPYGFMVLWPLWPLLFKSLTKKMCVSYIAHAPRGVVPRRFRGPRRKTPAKGMILLRKSCGPPLWPLWPPGATVTEAQRAEKCAFLLRRRNEKMVKNLVDKAESCESPSRFFILSRFFFVPYADSSQSRIMLNVPYADSLCLFFGQCVNWRIRELDTPNPRR